MAISNTAVHDNLVALSGKLAASGDVHDDLKGIASLAGNEGEAAVADVIQTLNFTTWISDICDGLQQEKQLDVETPEYNENAENIRESIQKINNLGYEMGFKQEIIPTPAKGKETTEAANAVYSNVALPYEAGAQVDYAKYMLFQEGKNSISRAMKNLSAQVAKSPQYGTHARNFWKAQVKAANNYSALNYEFLDGMDSLNNYTKQISEAKEFLKTEEQNAAMGVSTTQMGDFDAGDKIDFEGDDKALQTELREAITKADKLVKTERAMLKAGHVDSNRRALLDSTLKSYMSTIKTKRKAIEDDNVRDMQATAELEDKLVTNPDVVPEENEKKYLEMVKKQKTMAPTFTASDMESCAGLVKVGLGAMNTCLIASNVTPIGISMTPLQMVQVGKFIYDANKFLTKESQKESKSLELEPTFKGSKVAAAKAAREESKEEDKGDINPKKALAVKRAAMEFAKRMRIAALSIMQPIDENSPEYNANQNLTENTEKVVAEIVDENGNVIDTQEARLINQRRRLTMLDNSMAIGTGEHVFATDPQEMSDDEVEVNTEAIKAIMVPMKDENGKYLTNFSNCYGIGEEEMTDTQKENTENMTALMIIGQPAAALALRQAHTDLIALGERQKELESTEDLSHVEDNTADYEEINKEAQKADEKIKNIVDTYKPLCTKVGIMAASAMYQKSEYNKAWRESVREFNVSEVCKGTLMAMEESKRESERLNNERLYGPHGLLRA